MTRNALRTVLILAWLGIEAWLLLVLVGLGWARADSGVAGYGELASGIGLLMLLLFPGSILCLSAGRRALRVAAVVGVVMLGYGVVLVGKYHSVYEHDVNSGAISLGILLPGALVLLSAWLMSKAVHKTDAAPVGS
jgi:hypothetical protein